jgi:hypothetical protein
MAAGASMKRCMSILQVHATGLATFAKDVDAGPQP